MSGKSKKAGAKRAKSGKKASKNKGSRNALSVNPMRLGQPTEYKRVIKGAKGTGLSRCAELYVKALVNPFGEFDELPCVPCTPSDMTYKFRHVVRGSFQTGTAGVGFVTWSPLNPANNSISIYSSGTTFAGTTFSLTPTVGVTGATKSSLPYPLAAFSGGGNYVAGRLVASGLRIKNTTAPLYNQGSVLACRVATGVGLNTFSAAQLQVSLENVKDSAIRDGWFNWNWIPQDQEDYDFPDAAVDYSTSGKGYANFGIMVQGASTTNPSSFDFEIVEFWEFVSNSTNYPTPSLTKTHSDSVGLSRVLEAVSVPIQSLQLKDQAKTASENIVDSMAHSDSAAKTVEDLLGLAGMALPAINTIVGSLMSMILK